MEIQLIVQRIADTAHLPLVQPSLTTDSHHCASAQPTAFMHCAPTQGPIHNHGGTKLVHQCEHNRMSVREPFWCAVTLVCFVHWCTRCE